MRPATRHRLGRLLPHQLPDRPQVNPLADLRPLPLLRGDHTVLPHLSVSYPIPRGMSLRVTQPFAARLSGASSFESSLDLHISGTPPALILSQDQTLKKNCQENISKTQVSLKLGFPNPITKLNNNHKFLKYEIQL